MATRKKKPKQRKINPNKAQLTQAGNDMQLVYNLTSMYHAIAARVLKNKYQLSDEQAEDLKEVHGFTDEQIAVIKEMCEFTDLRIFEFSTLVTNGMTKVIERGWDYRQGVDWNAVNDELQTTD